MKKNEIFYACALCTNLVELLVEFELEVDGPELDELVEEGAGAADVPLLCVRVVCHLQLYLV